MKKINFMNKTLFLFSLIAVFFCGGVIGCMPVKNSYEKGFVDTETTESSGSDINKNIQEETIESFEGYNDGVLRHGALKINGGKIIDKDGNNVILKGMSSHGIVWFPKFINKYSIEKTKEYGANVFRAAMYTEEYGGYTTGENEKQNSEKLLYYAVDNAIELDMYAVIDWHVLSDANPMKHKSEAIEFFDKVSKKYAGNPAVIYEICNEPNGVNWKNDIKPYAEEIIPVIRKNSPEALIIVGTNTWSQDVDGASDDLLDYENVAYAFHFYAGTHKLDNFKGKIEKAISNGATVFVTEWGTSDASGNNGNYLDEAKKWLDYLDEKEISRINWSLCDKNESSAALSEGADSENWNESNLSKSGKFVFENLK